MNFETAHGLIALRPGANAETAGMVAASDERWLFVMINAVVQQMQQALPAVAEAMRWSDGGAPGRLPSNFSFVWVTDVVELGPVFLSLTLSSQVLSSYGDRAIHFRLVQPSKGVEPQ
ncbi:MAG: hypothetical protein ACU0BB_17665 [Paracoccaceae bacterium]